MCEGVKVDRVLEVKAYACPPWVARPEVVICEDREQAAALTEIGNLDRWTSTRMDQCATGRQASASMSSHHKHASG
jgi:hypothetical protein